MTQKDVREILEKQLTLLSEASAKAPVQDLPALTQAMISIGYQLAEKSFQVDGQ